MDRLWLLCSTGNLTLLRVLTAPAFLIVAPVALPSFQVQPAVERHLSWRSCLVWTWTPLQPWRSHIPATWYIDTADGALSLEKCTKKSKEVCGGRGFGCYWIPFWRSSHISWDRTSDQTRCPGSLPLGKALDQLVYSRCQCDLTSPTSQMLRDRAKHPRYIIFHMDPTRLRQDDVKLCAQNAWCVLLTTGSQLNI